MGASANRHFCRRHSYRSRTNSTLRGNSSCREPAKCISVEGLAICCVCDSTYVPRSRFSGSHARSGVDAMSRIVRNQGFQGARDDFEFDGEAGERFAVDLGVEGIFVERFAEDSVSFVKMNALGAAKIAGPKRWQIAEITEAALRGEGHDFELVFEEVSVGGDFERAAVVFGAADDGQGGVDFLIADDDAGFQVEVEGIDDHAVGAGTADAEKVFFLFGLFERSRQTEGNFFHCAANKFFGGAGNVPRQIQFLSQDVCCSPGKKCEGNAVAILMSCEAVDDFVERAVATASNDEAAAFVGGALGDLSGVARAGGFGEIGVDAAGGKNMASGIKGAFAAVAAATSVGIVNQQSVLEIRRHVRYASLPFVA